MCDSDVEEMIDAQRRLKPDGAEVAKVGEAELVEVFVADHAVVDEEEFDAGLDGGDAAAFVDDADEGVAGEDFGQLVVHRRADFGAEFFDARETAMDGFAVGVLIVHVFWVWVCCGVVGCGWGLVGLKHGSDLSHL